MNAATLRLALRFFRRDLRSAQFLVIGLAVLVAVGSITAVGSFTPRVRLALDEQSHALLAADLAVLEAAAEAAAGGPQTVVPPGTFPVFLKLLHPGHPE